VCDFASEVILVILGQFLNVLKFFRVLSNESSLLEDVDLVSQTIFFTEGSDI
jgi:hypothetical protein